MPWNRGLVGPRCSASIAREMSLQFTLLVDWAAAMTLVVLRKMLAFGSADAVHSDDSRKLEA
jgi:hypothetical protein